VKLEDVYPGYIAPYSEYPPQTAQIITFDTFDTAPHKVGGWVAEHWEPAHV
jgi:hypothetical protein